MRGGGWLFTSASLSIRREIFVSFPVAMFLFIIPLRKEYKLRLVLFMARIFFPIRNAECVYTASRSSHNNFHNSRGISAAGKCFHVEESSQNRSYTGCKVNSRRSLSIVYRLYGHYRPPGAISKSCKNQTEKIKFQYLRSNKNKAFKISSK